jgi:predicted branched-subunit amino acid permease
LGGAIAGSAIADPAELGIDLVFPLAFFALLVPLVRTRVELLVAVASGAIAYVAGRGLPGGLPILLAGVVGSLVGAALTSGRPDDEPDIEAAVREVA